MVSTPPCCPRCGSQRLIRFGFVAGQQRWRCKRCRYQFTRLEGHGTPEPRAAVSLYGYGLSFNAVADLLGTTAQSVLRWVCGSVDRCCTKPPPGDAVVIELDEMWHFLQRKDNKVWIWKACDRATGRLIDWEGGDRDERTFRRLFERLARWKVRLFCSDRYGVYPLVLAVGSPYQGKGETWNATTASSGIGPPLCGGAPSSSPSPSPCLSRIQRMRCRPDSGGLPP
jgi:IS1 family transposase/transposase-like protein